MAQRNTRIDRFAQMSKQEELIAKKRQEILEKQRTAKLAKQVAEAQTISAKMKIEHANETESMGFAACVVDIAESGNKVSATDGAIELEVTESMQQEGAAAVTVEEQGNKKIETEVKETKTEDTEASTSTTTVVTIATTTATTTASTATTTATTKSLNSFTGKTGKISFGLKRTPAPALMTEQPPPKVQNFFCNDGSFLENFKKILEQQQPKPLVQIIESATAAAEPIEEAETGTATKTDETDPAQEEQQELFDQEQQQQQEAEQQLQQQQQHQFQQMLMQPATSQYAPPPPPVMQPHVMHSHTMQSTNSSIPQPPMPPPPPMQPHHHHHHRYAFNPPPMSGYGNVASQPPVPVPMPMPPQPPHGIPTAFFSATPPQLVPPPPPPTTQTMIMPMSMHVMHNVAPPPPPPPPPQLPLALTNLAPLYMVPAPDALRMSALVNMQNGQQHYHHQQQQQQQQQQQLQQQQEGNNDQLPACIQLPTSLEDLIEMVAENGDDYEEKLLTHKTQLHPALWFLLDKNCEQYYHYRQRLSERQRLTQDQKYEPEQPEQLTEDEQLENQHNDEDMDEENEDEQEEQFPAAEQSEEHQRDNKEQDNMQNEKVVAREEIEESPTTSRSATGDIPTASAATGDNDKYDPESVIANNEDDDDDADDDEESDNIDSDDEYMRGMMDRNRDNIKRRIECRNELSEEERQEREAEEAEREQRSMEERKKQRKSRWGEKVDASEAPTVTASVSTSFGNQNKPMLATVSRTDPGLLSYARQNYGSVNLTEEDWKKCEEHYKVNLLYQDMVRKRQEIDRLARTGKFKYDYDSDEDVDGGTWEHKLRTAEMEATRLWANALTKQSEGKHHIGDFLPPEELKKFMEQYDAKKNNRQPDLSDYKEFKLKEDNIGFKMLQKLGWKEGQGLGQDGAGIVDPINKAVQRDGNQGLGAASAASPEECDNEYDAYRKRMMLAYRFRPNPLNNPRRAYY